MADQDFHATVRYEPPVRERRPFPRWILWLLLAAALLIGGTLLVLQSYLRKATAVLQESLPPAAVHVGSPLEWRELDNTPIGVPLSTGTLGGLFVADFDADGDEEALVISVRGKSRLYEADGTVRLVDISGTEFMMGGVAWDLERDGIAEIVVDPLLGDVAAGIAMGKPAGDIRRSKVLPVYDLSGETVEALPALAGGTARSLLTGDMDGDGHDELVATGRDVYERYRARGKAAFGADGKEVWRLGDDDWRGDATLGDVDGDGRAEYVTTWKNPLILEVFGVGQGRSVLTGWQRLASPHSCFDITGDGCDEVISPGLGFLNPSTEKLTPFEFPPGTSTSLAQVSGICCRASFAGGGGGIVVASRIDSWLLIFDETGRCRYYEELGDMLFSMAGLEAGGRHYLVVQLMERLLICP